MLNGAGLQDTLADAVRTFDNHPLGPMKVATWRRLRVAAPCVAVAGGAIALCMSADDATAAALGGVGTSVGLLAAIATGLLFRGWQSHLGVGGASTLVGLAALAVGVALLWRAAVAGGWRGLLRVSGASAHAPAATSAALEAEAIVLPDGIDRDRLIADMRRHFIDLQLAWDLGAHERIGLLTTPDMLEELCAARSAGSGDTHRTEVLSLDVQLLLFEERGSAQVVCVEFSGMVRESVAAAPAPFREFWMLMRGSHSAPGWRLARHQALL